MDQVRTVAGEAPGVAGQDAREGAPEAALASGSEAGSGDGSGGRPTVLRNRNFLLLWLGQLVSQLGDRVHALAVIWWVLEKTGSAALMGTVLIVATVPAVVLGPLAGGYVDRWNRKTIIVGMDFARGLIVVSIAFLAVRGTLEIWQLLVGTAAMAIASVFFGPAVSASVPNLVRRSEITRANSLSQMATQGTGIAGPALGGILVAVWGVGGVFLLNGLSFIASGLSELFISMPPIEPGRVKRKHIVAELGDGFSFVRRQPTIFGILKTAAVLNFFTAPFAILLPIVARDYLGRGAEAFGFIMAAFSVGFMAASAVLAAIKDVRRRHPLIILGVSLAGGCLIVMGLFITYPSYITLMASIGVLLGLANILIMSYFQAVVPDELRGRVFGFMMTLSGGLQPLAFGVVGLLTDLLSVPVIFVVSGCALVIGGLYLYLVPGMREV